MKGMSFSELSRLRADERRPLTSKGLLERYLAAQIRGTIKIIVKRQLLNRQQMKEMAAQGLIRADYSGSWL
jgi:hypothetical protein